MITQLTLQARDLMTPHTITIDGHARLREALNLMQNHKITALPVIDNQKRPIGVLSQTDIMRHLYENPEYNLIEVDYFEADFPEGSLMRFDPSENQDLAVIDIMTPLVFSLGPDTPIKTVVEEMLGRKVHRLFVIDEEGALAGVISSLDLVRHLQKML